MLEEKSVVVSRLHHLNDAKLQSGVDKTDEVMRGRSRTLKIGTNLELPRRKLKVWMLNSSIKRGRFNSVRPLRKQLT